MALWTRQVALAVVLASLSGLLADENAFDSDASHSATLLQADPHNVAKRDSKWASLQGSWGKRGVDDQIPIELLDQVSIIIHKS